MRSRPRRPSPGGCRALLELLAADPAALPALAALALLVAWAANQGGFPQTHWAPGALVLLALLAITVGAVGLRRARAPVGVKVAIGGLAAYAALSFLSILWARVKGDAWEGADRTLVYLIVFTLLATWRRPAASAALLVAAWTLAMAALAIFTVLHVDAAATSPARLSALMPGGRLIYPAGYVNADAAMWMIACFPALILAAARQVPAFVRGLLAGAAVVLAGAALYSQSRGSVFSTAIVIVLVFILLPHRVRTFATLVPIAAGVAALAPAVLRFGEHAETGSRAAAAAGSATFAVLLAAGAVAVVVGLAAAVESRARPSERMRARAHVAVATIGILAVVAAIVGGTLAVGDPVEKAEHEWSTFTSQKGYAANEAGQNRLLSGLGSSRDDFYRVAWHEFVTHPVLGIGADNFAVPYLRLRHSEETPHYPHSVEFRTLSETGLLGALVALVGLVAALVAIRRALRYSAALGRPVAAACLAGFGYWVVHGSFDWFFEYAALGGSAFALLGIACSLAPPDRAPVAAGAAPPTGEPRIAAGAAPISIRFPRMRRRLPALAVGLLAAALALLAAGSLAAPWLSRAEVQNAARIWPAAPAEAYSQLAEAAELNPLSDEPDLIAGTIALRRQELARADREFAIALRRSPEESYATLERGAIASSTGESGTAVALLRRAVALDPRNRIARLALATARRGRRVNLQALNRSILREAEHFS